MSHDIEFSLVAVNADQVDAYIRHDDLRYGLLNPFEIERVSGSSRSGEFMSASKD
jgi:hypothetical protein